MILFYTNSTKHLAQKVKVTKGKFIIKKFSDGEICKKKFGETVFANVMILGVALREKMLPISKGSVIKALKATAPRKIENNLDAFELGLKYTNKERMR